MLLETFETQLKKQQAIGMSYGSKMFAATIEDIIKSYYIKNLVKDAEFEEDGTPVLSYVQGYKNSDINFYNLNKKQLIEIVQNIFDFANNTIGIRIDELIDTIEKIQTDTSALLGKDTNKEVDTSEEVDDTNINNDITNNEN